MDLRELIGAFRLRWRIALAVVLISVAFGAGYVLFAPKDFVSTARLAVLVNVNPAVGDVPQNSQVVSSTIPTYASIIASALVVRPALVEVKNPPSVDNALDMITATADTSTNVIAVSATSSNPVESASLANAVSLTASKVLPLLQGRTESTAPLVVRLIEPAAVTSVPATPVPQRVLLIAFGGGLFLAFVVVVLLDLGQKARRPKSGGNDPEIP